MALPVPVHWHCHWQWHCLPVVLFNVIRRLAVCFYILPRALVDRHITAASSIVMMLTSLPPVPVTPLFSARGRNPFASGTIDKKSIRYYDSSLKGDFYRLSSEASLSIPFENITDTTTDGAGTLILQLRLPTGPIAGSPQVVLDHASVTITLTPLNSTVDRRLDLSTATRRTRATALHAQLPLKSRRGNWGIVAVDLCAHLTAAWGHSEAANFRLSRIEIRGAVDVRAVMLLHGITAISSSTVLPDAALFPLGSAARAFGSLLVSGSLDWESGGESSLLAVTRSTLGKQKKIVRHQTTTTTRATNAPRGGSPNEMAVMPTPLSLKSVRYAVAVDIDIPSPPPQPRSPLIGLAARSASRRALVFDLLKSPETAEALAAAVASSPSASAAFTDATDIHTPSTRLPVLRTYISTTSPASAAATAAADSVVIDDISSAENDNAEDAEEALLYAALAPSASSLHRISCTPPSPPPPPPPPSQKDDMIIISNPWLPRTPSSNRKMIVGMNSPQPTLFRSAKSVRRSNGGIMPRVGGHLTSLESSSSSSSSSTTPTPTITPTREQYMTPRRSSPLISTPVATTLTFQDDEVCHLNFDSELLLDNAAKNVSTQTQAQQTQITMTPAQPKVRVLTTSHGSVAAASAVATAAAVAASTAANASAAAAAAAATAALAASQPITSREGGCIWHSTYVKAYASLDQDLDKLLDSIHSSYTSN